MIFRTRTLLVTAIVVIVVCALLYGYLFIRDSSMNTAIDAQSMSAPHGKVAASRTPDGTYTVTIHSVMTTSEDTVITFTPVTTTATSTHESGEPNFMAPVTANTKVSLIGNPYASARDLASIVRTSPPIFRVTLVDGNIASITEMTPISKEIR